MLGCEGMPFYNQLIVFSTNPLLENLLNREWSILRRPPMLFDSLPRKENFHSWNLPFSVTRLVTSASYSIYWKQFLNTKEIHNYSQKN